MLMTTAQLELSFENRHPAACERVLRQPATRSARWWFERMRQLVDAAFDWQPALPPRPEQTWLPGGEFRCWTVG